MEDRNQEALKSYCLKIYNIYRARGAFLLETDCGPKLFKCFEGSNNRALFEHSVKEHLSAHGYYNIDLFVRTKDNHIISFDSGGCGYVMKNWYWGEECNLKEITQIEMAAANLARLHSILKDVKFTKEQLEYNVSGNLMEIFHKRNRELKRFKGYIWDKRQKNKFEILYLNYYDAFYEQGLRAAEKIKKSSYQQLLATSINQRRVCHGNYTYHNIMILKDKSDVFNKTFVPPGWINKKPVSVADISSYQSNMIATTNFEKCYIGVQICDLYQFIRKVMEKNDWDIVYGSSMIEAYDRVKSISREELEVLYLLLLYPEKFWKVTNYYYNGKKAWVSSRNIQKLNSVGGQKTKREIFLKRLESII